MATDAVTVTFPEAGRLLGVCSRMIYRLVAEGELETVRLPGMKGRRIVVRSIGAMVERAAAKEAAVKAEAEAARQEREARLARLRGTIAQDGRSVRRAARQLPGKDVGSTSLRAGRSLARRAAK